MDKNYTIFVGTIGNSLRCSRDGGETWRGTPSDQPLPDSGVGGLEGNVRALAVYPDNPHRILAGSDRMGIYRSDDNGESWRLLKSPMEGMEIWSIDVDPVNSDNIYVGTRPKGFRSRDGGESWEKLDISVDEGALVWPPRTTKMHRGGPHRQCVTAVIVDERSGDLHGLGHLAHMYQGPKPDPAGDLIRGRRAPSESNHQRLTANAASVS